MRAALALLALAWLAACDGRGEVAGAAPSGASQRDRAEPTASAEADTNRLEALRASTLPGGFELVTAPKAFQFPLDHGPHPNFRHEWWYVTGHLETSGGEPFGFELTFFRFALKPPVGAPTATAASESQAATEPQATTQPPGAAAPHATTQPPGAAAPHATTQAPGATAPPSQWRARQIYMAHFAVSDIAHKNFAVSERFARDALGLAGAQADPFRVSLDDWSLAATPDSKSWRLIAADKGYSLDLAIDPSVPLMLNGDAGFSRKSDAEGAASYYYSIPRMTAQGKLTRDGKSVDVRGTVWLDREWGSGALGSDQQGWDWFALQLDDGTALMFYALRKQAGQRDAHSAGTWLAPDGKTLALTNDDVQIDTTAEWSSPHGTRYPARWHVRVPKLDLDVDIEPRLADQELNTSTRYWEGASVVKGTRGNKRIEGKAYVELVGY